MSIISSDVIHEAAAAVGVSALSKECAVSLAADAEYRLREIVQDALNFKRHARRRKLTTADGSPSELHVFLTHNQAINTVEWSPVRGQGPSPQARF